MEDKLIIKNIKRKKECGLEMFIDKYAGFIRAVIRSKLYKFSSYEDECFDDILLAIWNNVDRFDESKGSFKNWVVSVSKYKIIDYNRKQLKNNSLVSSIDMQNIDEKHLSDANANVERSLLGDEVKKEIDDLLSNLSLRDKDLFIKHYLEEKPVTKISSEVGTKVDVIYNRLSRGRTKLRKILAHSKLF